MVHQSWDEVYKKEITEFLTLMCYSRDLSNWEKAETEKWKNRH